MIIIALALVCAPIGWAGMYCLFTGAYLLGEALLAASLVLGLAVIYLIWRRDRNGEWYE